MKGPLLLLASLCMATATARAASVSCKGNPAIVGQCTTLRGRVSVYNGTPSIRVWPVGTKRLLGVVPSENESMPEHLKSMVSLQQDAFATLEVCPLSERRPGVMQFICIESATNVITRRR